MAATKKTKVTRRTGVRSVPLGGRYSLGGRPSRGALFAFRVQDGQKVKEQCAREQAASRSSRAILGLCWCGLVLA